MIPIRCFLGWHDWIYTYQDLGDDNGYRLRGCKRCQRVETNIFDLGFQLEKSSVSRFNELLEKNGEVSENQDEFIEKELVG